VNSDRSIHIASLKGWFEKASNLHIADCSHVFGHLQRLHERLPFQWI
jgi:hypothetical protein